MKTARFRKSWKNKSGIAISLQTPEGWKGVRYEKLAPDPWMLKLSWEEFERAYRKKLEKLDPAEVWKELHELVDGEPVLLCWEKSRDRCHRRLVAEWLEAHLGVEVPEVGDDQMKLF